MHSLTTRQKINTHHCIDLHEFSWPCMNFHGHQLFRLSLHKLVHTCGYHLLSKRYKVNMPPNWKSTHLLFLVYTVVHSLCACLSCDNRSQATVRNYGALWGLSFYMPPFKLIQSELKLEWTYKQLVADAKYSKKQSPASFPLYLVDNNHKRCFPLVILPALGPANIF